MNTRDKQQLVSLNISRIKEIKWRGRIITTGIFKEPTTSRLEVKGVNISGDDQADRSVHGGIDKAVYAYPAEHYDYWRSLYPKMDLPHGMFGENLTTIGLLENQIYVGDLIQIGTVKLIAVQPRMPCFKLGIKFGTHEIIKQFIDVDLPGIYFKIEKEGELGVGDQITFLKKNFSSISIKDVYDIIRRKATQQQLEAASKTKDLPMKIKNLIAYDLENNYFIS